MKLLSRILTICLCSAPLVNAGAFGAVATTAGHNLTAYNPSNTNNNQWATLTNGREDLPAPTAKANYGNCNALITRCATPKCASGGCTDMNVATAIVNGCVQINESCKQYGDGLVSYMAAQLVAASTARANAQQAAATASQNSASSQQISEMQQQMYQMQQQMAQQNEQTQKQLQNALAQQQAQNAAALESMKAAATEAAQKTDTGLTSAQEKAIEKGVTDEVLERQKMTGQIMSEIDGADASLEAVKKAMEAAFKYAGCDSRGNNCSGPKRMKKFRELAMNFIEPYDNVADKIDDALDDAQLVGVDITPIYMMLSDSCKSWANFLCPHMEYGRVYYDSAGLPLVCRYEQGQYEPYNTCHNMHMLDSADKKSFDECLRTSGCVPCTVNKRLTSSDDIYAGWTNFDYDASENNNVVVACQSGLLERSSFLGRRVRRKNGAGIVNIEDLETWLSQTEEASIPSDKKRDGAKYLLESCDAHGSKSVLEKARLSKTISDAYGQKLCVDEKGKTDEAQADTCPYINPIYAICDTHAYNAGFGSNSENASERDQVHEIVALKTTVLAQQMYKQYEYLAATLRRLKTHLEKAVFNADLQAAGAKSEDASSSGSGYSSYTNKDESIYLSGAANCYTSDTGTALNCIESNIRTILASVKTQRKKSCQQLVATVTTAKDIFSSIPDRNGNVGDAVKLSTHCDNFDTESVCGSKKEGEIRQCANGLTLNVSTARQALENNRNYRYGGNRY